MNNQFTNFGRYFKFWFAFTPGNNSLENHRIKAIENSPGVSGISK